MGRGVTPGMGINAPLFVGWRAHPVVGSLINKVSSGKCELTGEDGTLSWPSLCPKCSAESLAQNRHSVNPC